MTVAPVVVSPEVASNTAWVKLRWGGAYMNGTAETRLAATQVRVTTRKPSRSRS